MKSKEEILSHFKTIFETCSNYPKTGFGLPTSDPRSKAALKGLQTISKELEMLVEIPEGWTTKFSSGSGAFPKIPWILFAPPEFKPPSQGIYVCITFSRNGEGCVAGAMCATGERQIWQKYIQPTDESWGLPINGVKPNTKFESAYFNPKPFYRSDLNEAAFESLIHHLKSSVEYVNNLKKDGSGSTPMMSDYDRVDTFDSLDISLLAKPFTILTGASGTGKTKLAISLAKYLSNADASNYEVVAVGADWTDNRNVLGFVNHLNTDEEGPRYQSTPILDLLLRAKDYPRVPYFLILDEMNLSHVERYFADFLSAMEQKSGPLKLHSENGKLRRSGQSEADVPPELDYPDNLFVIGTVNIDETTYMFSPKVLDRANVIEFTVTEDEIGAFLSEPHAYPEIEPAEPGVAEGFLQLAKQAREIGCEPLPPEPASKITGHLLDLFKILKAERFEFAYRTAKEINIYLQVCRHLAGEDSAKASWDSGGWRSDLDDQILQKLLPKLHGSVGRIGKLLATLAHYCQSGELQTDVSTQLSAAAELDGSDETTFPKSLAKLQSMIRTLQDEQFVSFIQ